VLAQLAFPINAELSDDDIIAKNENAMYTSLFTPRTQTLFLGGAPPTE
jgi:hypothetical protein